MLWDWTQARSIVQSENIPRAFLSTPAFRLWSIKSYTHFCLLSKIRWGRTLRQRFVMMVYFALQGFTASLVSIPRLIVYGCILIAAKNIPDMGTSQQAFQTLQSTTSAILTSLDSLLLRIALVVMALSLGVYAIHLIIIVLASVICTLSLCYLGRMRKAMTRDLESRIMSLVGSTNYRGRDGSDASQSDVSTGNSKAVHPQEALFGMNIEQNTFQHNSSISVSFLSEKSTDEHCQSQLKYNGNGRSSLDSQDVFYQIDLGQQPQTSVDISAEQSLTPNSSFYPSSSDTVPLVNLSVGERIQSQQPDPMASFSLMQSITTLPSINSNIGMDKQYLSAPHNSYFSNHCQSIGMPLKDSVQHSSIDQLPQNNRLAALSFYDDLLKSINSERMIYANQAISDDKQNTHSADFAARRESHNQSINSPSIALCSSIPLTYSRSCSEYDDRLSTERPLHPFDTTPCQPRFSTPRSDQDATTTMADIYIHPLDLMDIKGGLEINLQSQPGSQENLQASFRNLRQVTRSGSPHSQETIENWRIHVAPSSPVIPDYDFDMQNLGQRKNSLTPTPTAPEYNEYNLGDLDNEESGSRRGTIPIILSSHLQEAAALYQNEQDYYSIADDLHVPRPFYAYGHGRTQRQGSIQSSIGGCNYSTAASSPSLADSLSNPMYHQQTSSSLNPSGYPRTFPPRKGSLPCSIISSTLEDIITPRGSQFAYQQSLAQNQIVPLTTHNGPSSRMRPRAPSHLSNMVSHADGLASDSELDCSDGVISLDKKRGHSRSQSQGSYSLRHRNTSWNQVELFKDTSGGNTVLSHVPITKPSYMNYQNNSDDDHDNIRMSIKASLSLKEALMIDGHWSRNSMQPQEAEHIAASIYNGEIDDKMLHPLDLSPLLQTQSRTQQNNDYPNQSSIVPDFSASERGSHNFASPSVVQQAWDETCIGLGLTMATTTHYHDPQYNYLNSNDDIHLQRPIPIRYHSVARSVPYAFQHSSQQKQSDMTTNSTSKFMTHTLQSDATLHSNSYATLSSATSATYGDMSYTNSMFSQHSTFSSSHVKSINEYHQDHQELAALYYHHHDQHFQQPQRQILEQSYPPLQMNESDGVLEQQQSQPQLETLPFRRENSKSRQLVQRQLSQRNKKNLVVTITPPNQTY
ncbi:hypothetical protein FBU30_009099 [Linnemannia zychae]|nr:hypothetical protein FBU30_009099 [Linnemannia zychae]